LPVPDYPDAFFQNKNNIDISDDLYYTFLALVPYQNVDMVFPGVDILSICLPSPTMYHHPQQS
jgi:hypothetical protein